VGTIRHNGVVGSNSWKVLGFPLSAKDIKWLDHEAKGALMKRTMSTIANLAGVATLMFVGYAVLTSLSDLKRYIRISTM
jgi:hypothetical protein